MGLLSEGSPLSWEETKALAEHVREHGVQQFINLYYRLKDRHDVLKWGDEVEYVIVKFDDDNKIARVSLKAQELLQVLNQKEADNPDGVKSLWRPEYGAFMIESTPGKPFLGLMKHFNLVEANMRYRRLEVTELLEEDECIMSITNFPRLGCPEFTYPIYYPNPEDPLSSAKSLYFPDEAISSGHPRFKTATRNIGMRRGEKVSIKLKAFKDENTKYPIPGAPPSEPDVVHMDAVGLGMGCCCLQLTFQASDLSEARKLYDQLAPLSPIMLALTAASPIYRGYLTESDCRWNVLSSAVDCRTAEERGLKPLKNNKFRIAKSRYDSIDSFLSPEAEQYNDVPVTYDEKAYKRLRDSGIDHLMAQHVAHLFIRDPLLLLSEKIHQNDEEETDHFENIQSTNWQTMRFKPPPPNSSIGWRVEFRPCETQISDFENAALVVFVVLLTRVILYYQLNFLMPISRVDENMQIAQKRDACRKEKFWFRKIIQSTCECCPKESQCSDTNGTNGAINCTYINGTNDTSGTNGTNGIDGTNGTKGTSGGTTGTNGAYATNGINNTGTNGVNGITDSDDCSFNGIIDTNSTKGANDVDKVNGCTRATNGKICADKFELMTLDEIFNGKTDSFCGLVPLIRSYLQSKEVDADTHCTIERYLRFIEKRAAGELMTTATWMREQVLNHPDYKKDSVVSDSINYDLLKKIQKIQDGKTIEPTLLGYINYSKTKDYIPSTLQKHLALNGCNQRLP